MLFYKHEQCMIPDNCSKYEQITTFFSDGLDPFLYAPIPLRRIKVNFAQFYFLSGINVSRLGNRYYFFIGNHLESLQQNNIGEACSSKRYIRPALLLKFYYEMLFQDLFLVFTKHFLNFVLSSQCNSTPNMFSVYIFTLNKRLHVNPSNLDGFIRI